MTVFYIANAPQISVPQSVTMRQARLALDACLDINKRSVYLQSPKD